MRASAFFIFLAGSSALAGGAAAQTRLPPGTPPAIQRDVETIDRYYAEADKRSGEGGEEARGGARFTPLVIAPPRTSITPNAPERDPFEVSPRLRAGNARAPRFDQQEGMTLSQILRLRAVVRGPQGGIAKIESGKDVIVVRDGDELDVNNIRYTVTVEADGVSLRGAGAPQYKMLVR
ncbi:MAG: hypothetical protein LBR95_05880 [Azoarcus sp.]|nr:hypothetical protein [Azoarcus sp.]